MRCASGTAPLDDNFTKSAFLNSWRSVVTTEDQPSVFGKLEENLNKLASEACLALSIPMAYLEFQKAQ
jgi:hypothetical protein